LAWGRGAVGPDRDARRRRPERLRGLRNGRRDDERCSERARTDCGDLEHLSARHAAARFGEQPLLLELGHGLFGDCRGLSPLVRLARVVHDQSVRDLVERRSFSFAHPPNGGGRLRQAMGDIQHAVIDQELVPKLLNHEILGAPSEPDPHSHTTSCVDRTGKSARCT
jgi:hypothetical protein